MGSSAQAITSQRKVSQDGIQSQSYISTRVCFQVSPFDLTTHTRIATWAPPPGHLWPLTSCQVNRSGSSSCKGINTESKLNIDYDMTMTKSEKLSFSWNINSAVCFYLNECCLICNPQKIWVKFFTETHLVWSFIYKLNFETKMFVATRYFRTNLSDNT